MYMHLVKHPQTRSSAAASHQRWIEHQPATFAPEATTAFGQSRRLLTANPPAEDVRGEKSSNPAAIALRSSNNVAPLADSLLCASLQ